MGVGAGGSQVGLPGNPFSFFLGAGGLKAGVCSSQRKIGHQRMAVGGAPKDSSALPSCRQGCWDPLA